MKYEESRDERMKGQGYRNGEGLELTSRAFVSSVRVEGLLARSG